MVEKLSFKKKFIVFGIGLLFFLLFAFYIRNIFSSQDKLYYILFKNSVNGLKEGCLVTYKGVDIGTVSEIRVQLPEADLVKVTIRIKNYFPVYSNYFASLSIKGFSGYYTIDLDKGSGEQVEIASGGYIQNRTTFLEDILQNGPEVVKEAKVFFHRLNESITEKDLKKIAECINVFTENTNMVAKNLKEVLEHSNLVTTNLVTIFKKNSHVITKLVTKVDNDYSHIKANVLGKVVSLFQIIENMTNVFVRKATLKDGVAWKFT